MYKELHTLEDISENKYVLYKHSATCPISAGAKQEVDTFVEKHPDVPVYILTVQDDPDFKFEVAEHFSVQHESPQILIIKDGKVHDHFSHNMITKYKIESALHE